MHRGVKSLKVHHKKVTPKTKGVKVSVISDEGPPVPIPNTAVKLT